MSTTISLDKTDFIKFNVSPTFKKLALKKASTVGLTLSELGRLLFGWYLHGLIPGEQRLIEMGRIAKENFYKGEGKSFETAEKAVSYLDKLS